MFSEIITELETLGKVEIGIEFESSDYKDATIFIVDGVDKFNTYIDSKNVYTCTVRGYLSQIEFDDVELEILVSDLEQMKYNIDSIRLILDDNSKRYITELSINKRLQ